MIGVLNICHSATPAFSSNGEMPCVNSNQYSQCPSSLIAYSEMRHAFFVQILLQHQTERPPEA
jgi:hypothetical protein